MFMHLFKWLLFSVGLFGVSHVALSAPEKVAESVELAKSVPIADVHMHLVNLSLADHQAQMNRNNVRWGGGVGPATPDKGPSPEEVRKVLGNRYFFGMGQSEFHRVFFSSGPKGLVDPESVAFVEMFAVADEMLASKKAYGFGELHIDNSKSFSTYQFARKVKFDNPVVRRIYELANKHHAFVQFHMQGDDENIKDLERYLDEFPNAKTVLSHCLPKQQEVSYYEGKALWKLLPKHSNLYLDLSRKGSILDHKEAYWWFSTNKGPQEKWLKLIEKFPDRFMVGSDTHAPDENRYDAVMTDFREGLFPYLQPATVKKVAYENAVRVFGLRE
jgi:predicted TIM-barrel fold metal-dependent hydrolase